MSLILANNMQFIRTQKGISRKELAEAMGVTVSTIGLYEQGRREPDLDRFRELAIALDSSPNELLSFVPKKNTQNEYDRLKGLVTACGFTVTRENDEGICVEFRDPAPVDPNKDRTNIAIYESKDDFTNDMRAAEEEGKHRRERERLTDAIYSHLREHFLFDE